MIQKILNIIKELKDKLNEKDKKLKESENKLKKGKEKKEKNLFKFQWENHENCEFSNNNKKLKKIKNNYEWNTNIKGNKILKKNAINIFKITVNNINNDKSGLSIGIAITSCNFSDANLYFNEWNFNCKNYEINSKLKSFKNEIIYKDDIITFVVDLINGSLSVKKNDKYLGIIYDISKNEDLVHSVCNYFVGNEIEIIE